MTTSTQAALVRLLTAIDNAEKGDLYGGFGPGYENGLGIEVGTELQAARLLAQQVIADSESHARSALTFDHWFELNQPAGSVGDMERGWNACLTSLCVTPLADLPDARLVEVWQSMPGGPDGWLKHFGFLQFGQAVVKAHREANSPTSSSSDLSQSEKN